AHDRRFDYRFYVVKEQEPNAFAIPGGHIFVTSGLIRFVDTEDELAGVIGHEIAHSVLRHIDKAMERAKRLSLLTLAAIIAGAFLSKDAEGAATLTAGAMAMAQSLMLKYTRENEGEADQKGITYLTHAGYGSQAMVTFLKKIYRWQRAISPDIPTYLSTHPGIDDRITYLSDTFTSTPKSLVTHPPAAGDLKKMQIRLFLREKGGTEGINQFSSLLREKPGNVDILYGLGVSYVMVGRTQEAISSLSEALKASPNDALIARELGIAYFEAKEVDKALDTLKDTERTFPHDTTILYYLAQGNQEKGRWDEALSFYQRVLKLEPGRVELYYNLGVVYDKKGFLGLSHENFGLYFKEKGERETALFHFRKALEHTQDWRKKRELEELIKECEVKGKRDKNIP
ncbi:MAG: M48 family metalloprotease, partial [Desulfobacterales bacterium]|nr:M48 family metalloprotease [Desulfobacterales bacterium]